MDDAVIKNVCREIHCFGILWKCNESCCPLWAKLDESCFARWACGVGQAYSGLLTCSLLIHILVQLWYQKLLLCVLSLWPQTLTHRCFHEVVLQVLSCRLKVQQSWISAAFQHCSTASWALAESQNACFVSFLPFAVSFLSSTTSVLGVISLPISMSWALSPPLHDGMAETPLQSA